MAKSEEGVTVIHAKVAEVTKERLQELAGGPRKIGVYLDQVVAMLYDAQEELDTAVEDERDSALVKKIREAIERGERETVPLAEVEDELRAKGLLSVL